MNNPGPRVAAVATMVMLCWVSSATLAADSGALVASEKRLARDAADAKRTTFSGDAERGWGLFREKRCISCHAVWGQGGDAAPDLGRTRTLGHTTAGQLAGIMWNHVPRMWEEVEGEAMAITPISPEEMSHLFALLLFIRYADELGDADEGKRVLAKQGCADCHSIEDAGKTVGADLAEWARYVNPVVWAKRMRIHSDAASSKSRSAVAWPYFDGGDPNDVMAYVRSRAASGQKEYLEPGSTARGKKVFEQRGCARCHKTQDGGPAGSDLSEAELPSTLCEIASQLWHHSAAMREEIRRKGEVVEELGAQEMADVITFLIARRYFLAEGDAEAGAHVFLDKQCVSCHAIGERGGRVGPGLNAIEGNASPVLMGQVMWQFGPRMLAEMAERGIRWPHFEGSEMADLIAFLNRETRREK